MLPKDNRLAKVRDFNLLLKFGKWVKEDGLSARVLSLAENKNYFPKKEDPELFSNQLKFAFSVGLKASKKAVERNRLKRQLREAVRLLILENMLKRGYYVMFVPDPKLKDLDFAEINKKLKLILLKGKVLK